MLGEQDRKLCALRSAQRADASVLHLGAAVLLQLVLLSAEYHLPSLLHKRLRCRSARAILRALSASCLNAPLDWIVKLIPILSVHCLFLCSQLHPLHALQLLQHSGLAATSGSSSDACCVATSWRAVTGDAPAAGAQWKPRGRTPHSCCVVNACAACLHGFLHPRAGSCFLCTSRCCFQLETARRSAGGVRRLRHALSFSIPRAAASQSADRHEHGGCVCRQQRHA